MLQNYKFNALLKALAIIEENDTLFVLNLFEFSETIYILLKFIADSLQ